MSDSTSAQQVATEDWKTAVGIKHRVEETNAALTERDYSVSCEASIRIAQIEGYNIWWCTAHHQPLPWCEKSTFAQSQVAQARREQRDQDANYLDEMATGYDYIPERTSREANYDTASFASGYKLACRSIAGFLRDQT